MPADELTVAQKCGVCDAEVGAFTVKKDNMMLMTSDTVWCPACQADRPEVRELAGRLRAIEGEKKTYAANLPVDTSA